MVFLKSPFINFSGTVYCIHSNWLGKTNSAALGFSSKEMMAIIKLLNDVAHRFISLAFRISLTVCVVLYCKMRVLYRISRKQ